MMKQKSGALVVFSLLGLSGIAASAGCADRPASKAVAKETPVVAPAPSQANSSLQSALPDAPRQASPFEAAVYSVPVSKEDPQKGSADALVTVVMFGDFDCEFSKQALVTMDGLLDKYGQDVRLVWKNRPMGFYPNAKPAAYLAMEAFAEGGSPKFWKTAELLFANRTELDRKALEKYAAELKLDRKKVKAALDKEIYKEKVQEDMDLSRRVTQVPTTPMLLINGRYLRGAQKPRLYELLINEELTKARAKVAQGTPKQDVYEQIVLAGATAPVVNDAGVAN